MEIRNLTLEIKADADARTIEGLGSVFNNVDGGGDIVLPGAFAKSIAVKMPKMLWQHKSDMVIGKWDEVRETPEGLFLKGRLLKTTLGNDAYELALNGAIDGLSIGYSTKDSEFDRKSGTRKLKAVELHEVSLVTFPMNEKAGITRVKSLDGVPFEALHEHKRMVEAALRDAGASDQLATYVASLIPTPASRDAKGEEKQTVAEILSQFTKTYRQ